MANQQNLEKMQLRQNYRNLWHTDLMRTIQTQHKVEMDKRDGKFGPQPAMAVPPVQQMSRIDQPVPPSVGYAPQPAYGQNYGYPPAPPPAQGYPATGYPPAAYPPQQGYPPTAYPSQGYPPTAYPPQGYPPSGYSR